LNHQPVHLDLKTHLLILNDKITGCKDGLLVQRGVLGLRVVETHHAKTKEQRKPQSYQDCFL